MNIIGIIWDLTVFSIYYRDHMKIMYDLYYILDLMEVKNVAEVSEVIGRNYSVISYPVLALTQFMAFMAAKFFVPLLFMLIFGLFSIKSMWQAIDENKRIKRFVQML